MAELLVEIGFEEMPAPWLPGLAEQMRARFLEAAGRELLEAGEVAVAYTPRRLVLRTEVPARQPDREEPVWGPSLKVARDAAGKWTGAALGFAKKNAVAVEDLAEGAKDPAKPGERNLLHVRKVAGRPTAEVLPGLLAGVLRGLAFPKRMSWDAWLEDGKGAFPFGRPIRWLVFLLDGAVVPFAIHALERGGRGGVIVQSGALTRGHRFLPKGLAGEDVVVRSWEELSLRLRERFVILAPEERASRIEDQLRAAASGGTWHDHGLREEWRDLVEYPSVLVGEVPREFRSLPPEVLETVLVHHQKSISLRDEAGAIARFAAVVNGDGAAAPEIVRGLERVVVARLRDAAFFLAEDRKRALSERVEELAGVTFQQGLGTYRDKAARMARLVQAMGRQGVLSGDALARATRAAELAKADLVTLMVREFPELQGVVGGIYLAAEGAPDEVATAVRWHYHPVAVEPDAEPAAAFAGKDDAARVFAAVALADKLDTLAGYFLLGESPSGSRDPYGLRRAGQGAVRAVLDFWRPRTGEKAPDLQALLGAAIDGYDTLSQPAAGAREAAEAFLLDRLEYLLSSRGFSPDEVQAVVEAPAEGAGGGAPGARALRDPIDALRRVEALQRVRREVPEDFAALAEAFKRAKNILSQARPAPAVDPSLFEAEAETALFAAASRLEQVDGSYEQRLRGLAALRAPVGRFFDDVMVMAEDPRVRGNRLALLNLTLSLFYRISDISKLGGSS
ncbi:MAG TPA: glycine--tRNA ligase subunit beta [Vicinamibacteria bacterium]|nr:glycine--tRNA ligase subunit beta [Vicinamibacteria bacterium]